MTSPGRAGCLAPSESPPIAGPGYGPFWGNDAGAFLYARLDGLGRAVLALRPSAGAAKDIAIAGDANGFQVGTQPERWESLVSGTVNGQGDAAFVAFTKPDDDPGTPEDEAVSRRGVYAQRGSTLYEIARFGNPSPERDVLNAPVPWGSLFDAAAADRDGSNLLSVVFSGQLAGASDHRLGLYRWSEQSPAVTTRAAITGTPDPDLFGGSFSSIGRLRGNGAGDVVFFGLSQLTPTAAQVPGLWLLRAVGGKGRLLKFGTDGDPAPTGGTFGQLGDFDLDDAGAVHFAASVLGGAAGTGLFRIAPPYDPSSVEAVLAEGDATPLGGTFGSFAAAVVRSNATGDLVFSVPLSEDVGATGVFTLPTGSTQPVPLVTTDEVVSVAALGLGRAGYETPTEVRVVTPSDGSEQGPTDFRIVSLDLRDAALGRKDAVRFEGRFLLPPWDTGGHEDGTKPPATLRGDAVRNTPGGPLTGALLARVVEVKVTVGASSSFTFGIGGTDALPAGSYGYNGHAQEAPKLTVTPDGGAAKWKFSGDPGPGSFSLDLSAGTFRLAVSKAYLLGSGSASSFHAALVLRSEEDVALARPDDQSYFVGDLNVAADESASSSSRRLTSKGENVPGGTVFVDSLRVTRKPAKGTKAASDKIALAGTLRSCPGSVAPAVPYLPAAIGLGDYGTGNVSMTRVGRSGSSYRYRASGVDLRVDVVKGTFSLKASGTAALTQLADPSAAAGNDAKHSVGGMDLVFTLTIPRVYAVSFRVPMTRLKGGKVFTR